MFEVSLRFLFFFLPFALFALPVHVHVDFLETEAENCHDDEAAAGASAKVKFFVFFHDYFLSPPITLPLGHLLLLPLPRLLLIEVPCNLRSHLSLFPPFRVHDPPLLFMRPIEGCHVCIAGHKVICVGVSRKLVMAPFIRGVTCFVCAGSVAPHAAPVFDTLWKHGGDSGWG